MQVTVQVGYEYINRKRTMQKKTHEMEIEKRSGEHKRRGRQSRGCGWDSSVTPARGTGLLDAARHGGGRPGRESPRRGYGNEEAPYAERLKRPLIAFT